MNSNFVKVNNPKYELYRSTSSFSFYINFSNFKSDLTKIISDIFKVDKDFIYLFHSASEAIIQILKYHKNIDNICKVYIPTFSCTELADAVLSSGCKLFLYDLDFDLNPPKEFLSEISSRKDLILIMPSLFGLNEFSKELYNYLKYQKYVVIFDEAQSFPMPPRVLGKRDNIWYSVISFGKTKPISSLGGGAIISHCLNKHLYKNVKNNDSNYLLELLNNIVNTGLNKLLKYNLFCGFIRRNIKKEKLYNSLEELQNNSKISYKIPMKISKLQKKYAISRIKKYEKWTSNRNIDNAKKELLRLFECKLGNQTLKLIKRYIKFQSVFALYINSHKRHYYAKKLADVGVQTTLYYFPIHLIKRYSGKHEDAFSNTYKNSLDLISSILIIPCNIDYSAKDIKKMCERIGNIL